MDDTQRTQRILSGRFIAGAALPYTDEHGITWSLDFSDVKGITRRMVQAEAHAAALVAVICEWDAAHDDTGVGYVDEARLRTAVDALRKIARAALTPTPPQPATRTEANADCSICRQPGCKGGHACE